MKSSFRAAMTAIAIATLAACGGGDTSEQMASGNGTAALSLPGTTPVPLNPATGKPSWDGSAVELMFADAMASCWFDPHPQKSHPITYPFEPNFNNDEYIWYIQSRMRTSVCRYTSSDGTAVDYGGDDEDATGWRWLDQRNDKNCNMDPSTKAKAPVPLSRSLPMIDVTSEAPFGGVTPGTTELAAERALKIPITNLCIAQHLRSAAPGASGGEALLLSAADQRQLLVLQKERAQMAMLQFALLGQVFATPQLADPGPVSNVKPYPENGGYPYLFIPMLQQWAHNATDERAALLETLGDELAAAVQLHATTSQELARLLGRSGSAHLPRGASSSDPAWKTAGYDNVAVDTWGPGSWRERAMASLFGGDPLVEDQSGSTPWRHFTHAAKPGAELSWPDVGDSAVVSARISDPKVTELLGLAERADALYLQRTASNQRLPNSKYECPGTEVAASAARLYRATEAYIRTNQCADYDPASDKCHVFVANEIPDPSLGHAGFHLWNKYRITPTHAEQLVTWLENMAPKKCVQSYPVSGGGTVSVDVATPGGFDFAGQVESKVIDGLPFDHLTDLRLEPQVLRETEALYARYSRFFMPSTIHPEAEPATQGFQLGKYRGHRPIKVSYPHEEMRRMGSVAALAATRDAFVNAARMLPSRPEAVRGFFRRMPSTLGIIENAIGRNGISIHPVTRIKNTIMLWDPLQPGQGELLRPLVEQEVNDAKVASWNFDVTVDASDAFWVPGRSADYSLFAVPYAPAVAALAEYAGSKVYGRGIEDYLADPRTIPALNPVVMDPPVGTTNSKVWHFDLLLPAPTSDQAPNVEWSFVVRRPADAGGYTYQPLATRVRLETGAAQYLAFNGSLSNFGAQIVARDRNQPSSPAFDGFGLPLVWSPPTDPALFGGGDNVVAGYLQRARTGAEEATAAVKEAFEEMLKQQQDEAQLQAAVAKGEKVATLERRALCGSGNCDTSMTEVTLDVPGKWNTASPRATWFRVEDTIKETDVPRPTLSDLQSRICVVPAGSTWEKLILSLNPQQRLDCLASVILTTAQRPFKVLTAVAKQRNAPAAPDFSEYAGGTLQAVAIEQWAALRGLEDRIRSFIATTDASIAHVDLLEKELDRSKQQNKEMYNRCGRLDDELFRDSLRQCAASLLSGRCDPKMFTRGWDDLTWSDEVSNSKSEGGGIGLSFILSASMSMGSSSTPMSIAGKRRLCEGYRDKLDGSAWRLTEGLLQAYANVEERRNEFTEATARVQAAAARAASLRHQTDLAIAKNDLEVELLRASQKTSFGLYRQLHSYDAWRAKALLDSARISAAIARKAIESRYVVNLSSLNAPEPLVASPASWADEVYEYDLDMPAAVGLAVGDPVPGGVYPNRVLDYVGNLERFVNGYSIARPTSVAEGDTEIVSLPGPKGLIDGNLPVQAIYPVGNAYAWSYLCSEGTSRTWRTMPPSGRPTDACLPSAARPLRARLLFALDAWGRLHGDVANEPFDKRYNARWMDLAVNLVGTGVRDCNKAVDKYGCQSEPFVRYQLLHSGTPWITDAEQSWSLLPVSTGRIEGGKALAAELWFDPIENSWSKPFVAAVTRSEFVSRPFGGAYELEFDVGPELVLEKIERVQVLASSRYWVKQQ